MKYHSGERPGKGEYRCTNCGYVVTLGSDDEALPRCPSCGHTEFEMVE